MFLDIKLISTFVKQITTKPTTMEIYLSVYTSISLHDGDDTTLHEDISTYCVDVTEKVYHGNYDTPGYTEYDYDVKGDVDGKLECLLIKAAEKYVDDHGYDAPEPDWDDKN